MLSRRCATASESSSDQARASPPLPAVGILRAGDEIALVGVSAITPEENADFQLPPGPQSVLIYVKRVDEPLLTSFAEAMQLEELRLVHELEPSWSGRPCCL